MARYRPVLTSIWVCDDKFQEYSPEGKLLFLYLITNEHVNEAGVYKITYKTIANETDIPKDRVIELIKGELSNNVSYDEENNVIFVHKFLKYNGGGNPELLKKSVERDKELIKTTLWKEFDKYYSRDLKPLKNRSKTVAQGIVRNRNSNSNKIIDSLFKEDIGVKDSIKYIYPPLFEDFWKEYPRKKEKKVAFTAWKQLKKNEQKAIIIAAKNYYIECKTLKRETEYIKYPATFIRKERWKDYMELPSILKSRVERFRPPEKETEADRRYREARAEAEERIRKVLLKKLKENKITAEEAKSLLDQKLREWEKKNAKRYFKQD